MRTNSSKKPTEVERNKLSKNTKVVGDIVSDGDFRIDGNLEGNLKTNGRVIIGVDGVVKGNVEASNAEIEGKFSGDLKVENTLIIKTSASITGDVSIGKLSVEPGANFNATCVMRGTVKELNQSNEQRGFFQKQANK